MSSQVYAQSVLKVAVAQICQTIGWHSAHTSTMDLLVDVTQHFLREITRSMHRYSELYNRTEANLDDLALAYKDIGINLQELMEYIQFVDPIQLPLEVPRFPLPKESNLNFLKPGSREVLMRPVHIPEHMPPIFFENEEDGEERNGTSNDEDKIVLYSEARGLATHAKSILSVTGAAISNVTSDGKQKPECTTMIMAVDDIGAATIVDDSSIVVDTVVNDEVEIPMQTIEVKDQVNRTSSKQRPESVTKDKPPPDVDGTSDTSSMSNKVVAISAEEGRPTREISSVIMTTSGFISPAREGKLPESRIPIIPEDRPTQQSSPHVSSLPSMQTPLHAATTQKTSAIECSNALSGFSGAGMGNATHDLVAGGIGKAGGEKSTKKIKKKPINREKKKSEKNTTSTTSRKSEKNAAIGKLIGPKSTMDSDLKLDTKDTKEPTAPTKVAFQGSLGTPHHPEQTNTFGKDTGSKIELNEAAKFATTSSILGVPAGGSSGKVVKPAKIKVIKEKALKKRKSLIQQLIKPEEEAMLGDKQATPTALAPKSKRSQKSSKKSINQPPQFPNTSGIPPPLIGPLGLGTSAVGSTLADSSSLMHSAPGGSNMENVFGMATNTGVSSTTTLSLPLKKSPIASVQKHSDSAAPNPCNSQMAEQAAQLNLLQMMHPSLEITASPVMKSPEFHQKATSGKKSFDPKGTKSDTLFSQTAHDRDVIVIDDDKSPPHMSSPHMGTTGINSGIPMTKKQRKQAMNNPGLSTGTKVMGLLDHSIAGGTFGNEGRSGEPSLREFPSQSHVNVPSNTTTSSAWMGESGRLAMPNKGNGNENLFPESPMATFSDSAMQSKIPETEHIDAGPFVAANKKQKRPKQKPKGEAKRKKQSDVTQSTEEPDVVGKNPFALFPNPMSPRMIGTFDTNSAYAKYLNQSLQAVTGLRNPIPFGLFPLPSGPGLIPDNPLFPRLPPTYPGQPVRPGFPLGSNPFSLAGINQINNLLRMPRPLLNRHPMAGSSFNQADYLDEPLDPETKLAQTPLDLQKSTCNVAPLVPPSLFQNVSDNLALSSTNELLNLSVKTTPPDTNKDISTTIQSPTTKKDTTASSGANLQSSTSVSSSMKDGKTENLREPFKEDQVVILPAASVLPGASPPQRNNMTFIDIDESDGSQSTATTGGKSKDGKRKLKEHKKDRKLKDGKIKKKKDKKEKNKSKDRDREQLKELTAGTATSPGVMTMGMIGAEEALMEQLRKERKEKKEKRKDKIKKEKRKDRDRFVATAGGGNVPSIEQSGPRDGQMMGDTVPKLMLKLSGSNATQSPRSETPEKPHSDQYVTLPSHASKRDGSPELARISALVTRPPKLKTSSGTGSKLNKEDGTTSALAAMNNEYTKGQPFETDESLPTVKQSVKSHGFNSATSSTHAIAATDDAGTGAGTSSAGRGYKIPRSTDSAEAASSKSFGSGETSKKAGKESKTSKSEHHHHHASTDSFSTPVHMTDADGNTVWICPACGRVDDGTPMIGCDGCDAWYHWVCVGIQVPPDDNEDWYCRVCIGKKQNSQADEKQRKRKKKDKKTSKD
ncbi:uncharacterized protein LOC128728381 [Anopheles nili]|uniref:uncharacterized protein LOC128728381 n=1 Tax=Anopheles nili TaxID=185578 RepID=UPI00237BBE79|nr:uncharacterized protein LOC128728381 [Anopheles nili]